MKLYISLFISIFIFSVVHAQVDEFKLENALVVAQQDKQEDRYSLEVALIQLFNSYDIKTKASLNVIKQGGSPNILLNDSVQKSLKSQGIDTYMLVSVRGFDKRYKTSKKIKPLEDEIDAGHLFPIYRESAASVTFSFTFYKNGKPVHHELIRTGTVGSRDAVLKKLLRKVDRALRKDWM